jgi:carbon monoxide dehydrogenase subunit G
LTGGFFFYSLIQVGMQLTGRHTVTATPAALWTMLMDSDTLAKIIPGISRLEKQEKILLNQFLK